MQPKLEASLGLAVIEMLTEISEEAERYPNHAPFEANIARNVLLKCEQARTHGRTIQGRELIWLIRQYYQANPKQFGKIKMSNIKDIVCQTPLSHKKHDEFTVLTKWFHEYQFVKQKLPKEVWTVDMNPKEHNHQNTLEQEFLQEVTDHVRNQLQKFECLKWAVDKHNRNRAKVPIAEEAKLQYLEDRIQEWLDATIMEHNRKDFLNSATVFKDQEKFRLLRNDSRSNSRDSRNSGGSQERRGNDRRNSYGRRDQGNRSFRRRDDRRNDGRSPRDRQRSPRWRSVPSQHTTDPTGQWDWGQEEWEDESSWNYPVAAPGADKGKARQPSRSQTRDEKGRRRFGKGGKKIPRDERRSPTPDGRRRSPTHTGPRTSDNNPGGSLQRYEGKGPGPNKPCYTYAAKGFCWRGNDCTFAHTKNLSKEDKEDKARFEKAIKAKGRDPYKPPAPRNTKGKGRKGGKTKGKA